MERKMKDYLSFKPAQWDKAFVSERNNLFFLLPQFKINVDHIGATSVTNCRSFRNVDILVSTHEFVDVHTIAMMLESKEYRPLDDKQDINCITLVKKKKVNGCGVTVRVVQYASPIYNRFLAFKVLLQENFDRVAKYNSFRETLISNVKFNIEEYNKAKYDYINALIDEHFKFEE